MFSLVYNYYLNHMIRSFGEQYSICRRSVRRVWMSDYFKWHALKRLCHSTLLSSLCISDNNFVIYLQMKLVEVMMQ